MKLKEELNKPYYDLTSFQVNAILKAIAKRDEEAVVVEVKISKEMEFIVEMEKEMTNAYLETGKLIGFNNARLEIQKCLKESLV